jgi:hypothetical protein
MLPARTLSISVARDWRALYEAIWRPESFPTWASGLAQAQLCQEGERWIAQGPEGPIRIRFSAHNAYGVMDHWVETESGESVHIPLRIIENGNGAEVLLSLFRQPNMDDERFENDAEWVRRDLEKLKHLAESEAL